MSKYASLPDIDDGADVFETPDVPQEHSYSRESDSDDDFHHPRAGSPTAQRRLAGQAQTNAQGNENIDGERIDPPEARRRFGVASAAAQQRREGASERRPTRRRLPSASVYTAGEPIDEREKETPLERLRRLRLEMAELEEDVKKSEADRAAKAEEEGVTTPTGETDGKGKKREVSPAVILQQLQLLRGDLGGLEPKLESVLEADGGKEPRQEDEEGALGKKAKASTGLLAKLGLASETAQEKPSTPSSSSTAAPRSVGGEVKGGKLEKRLAEVEKVVGASEANVDDTHPIPPPLLQTLTRLDHLLTLLTQPRHLDSISRRVKVLVSDLERIHESRRKLGDTRPLNVALSGGMTLTTGGAEGKLTPRASLGASTTGTSSSSSAVQLPPDALQKIDALFTLLPRLDPLLPLAPRLLTRLQSLGVLHASAASFGENLSGLKDEVDRLGEGEKGLREVLEGLETSVRENEKTVRGNLESLGKRVEEVGRRLDALRSH
ncbi:hypothetical protein JCM8547_001880 [Rhodosporidiobolus lusitaniae]